MVVIGAGQAGLSGAYHLRRTGLEPDRDFVVLDHAPRPGGAWQFRWPSLTYGKVHGMHALPGMELTGAAAGPPLLRGDRRVLRRVRGRLRPAGAPAGRGERRTGGRGRAAARRDVRGRAMRDACADQRHRDLGPAVLAALSGPGDVPGAAVAHGELSGSRRVRGAAGGRGRRRGLGHPASDGDRRGRGGHDVGDAPAAGLPRGPVRRGGRAARPWRWSRSGCGSGCRRGAWSR